MISLSVLAAALALLFRGRLRLVPGGVVMWAEDRLSGLLLLCEEPGAGRDDL